MTLPQAIKTCLRKYADLSGRATRTEYWWWALAVTVLSFILAGLDAFIGFLVASGQSSIAPGFLQPVFAIAVFLPSTAVTVRRLHDIGKTGWWLLLWYGIIALGWATFAIAILIILLAVWGATNGHLGMEDIIALILTPNAGGERELGVDSNISFGVDLEFFLFGLFTLLAGILVATAATLGVAIWSIVWLARQGQPGPNPYGPDPRAPGATP